MLAFRPLLISLSWPREDQGIAPWVDAAHGVGAKVSLMAADVEDAERGAEAGADRIVAQGNRRGWARGMDRLVGSSSHGCGRYSAMNAWLMSRFC